MRPLLLSIALLSLAGCSLPVAAWTAIGAGAGACAAACAPVVNFERDVFDYVFEGEKDNPMPAPAKPVAP